MLELHCNFHLLNQYHGSYTLLVDCAACPTNRLSVVISRETRGEF